MTNKRKPKAEIIGGLIITLVGLAIMIGSFTSFPDNLVALYLAVPVLVAGLVILFSKDATRAGDKILELFERLGM